MPVQKVRGVAAACVAGAAHGGGSSQGGCAAVACHLSRICLCLDALIRLCRSGGWSSRQRSTRGLVGAGGWRSLSSLVPGACTHALLLALPSCKVCRPDVCMPPALLLQAPAWSRCEMCNQRVRCSSAAVAAAAWRWTSLEACFAVFPMRTAGTKESTCVSSQHTYPMHL